jgi:sn-glycerol 3-phosphate transport system ATP-binding protein
MNANGVSLTISGLRKSWGAVDVLKGIDLEIEAGTFLTLLGPSGCGKSTALRLIAGLDSASGGRIAIDGTDVTNAPPAERNIGMVFQNYALFPHMTARENILYGMKVRRTSKADQELGLKRVAALMNLGPLLDRRPGQLSGGQQQRVALARVLISNRPLVLMDEPLSNLDAKLRSEIRTEIKELNRKLGITIVYVTHDQSEALSMSDKVLLMDAGEAIQFGTPEELFREPANITAARFVGTPPMNVIGAAHLPAHMAALGLQERIASLSVGIRPENLQLNDKPTDTSFGARVLDCEYEGSLTLVRLMTDLGEKITVTLPSIITPDRGAGVHIGCRSNDIRVFRTDDGSTLPSNADGRLLPLARST